MEEAMLKFRYLLEFPTEDGLEAYLVRIDKEPTFIRPKITIPFMSVKSYIHGKSYFHPVNITIIDFIGPARSGKLMEWINTYYETFINPNGVRMGNSNMKKNMILKSLDPTGVEVNKWALIGCTPEVNEPITDYFSYSLEYEKKEITFTINLDRAFIETI